MKKTLLATAAIFAIVFVTSSPAAAESFPMSKQRQCGVEWKSAKSDAAVKALGWPAFWSACSKRHNAAGDTFTGTRAKPVKKATPSA